MRKTILICLLVLPLTTRANETQVTSGLSATEIQEGWLMLFDRESTCGWTIEGDAKIEKGCLVLGGGKATTATGPVLPPQIQFELEYKATIASDKKVTFAMGNTFSKELSGTSTTLKGTTDPQGNPVSIQITIPDGCSVSIQSLKVKPRESKSLFNGRDLTGWKIFAPEKYKSKWSVQDGVLTLKNGPGDLQTETAYADFLFQIECKTNGKNLNSGIFFRCLPDQYQQGYEAQIHNGFKDEDRTKPVDFGTGAIYRRQPSRRIVANDQEWFTLTILCVDNRFQTWVNGYQTVNWVDDRPADDNPRKGCKREKGHLSIQGHDPTTDLSFRNIRIVDLTHEKK